jgi:hypothetical protein
LGIRANARPAAGPAQSSALHDFVRSGPTNQAHLRALDDVIAAANRGIQRIRDTRHLAFSFLRYCGLSLS